MSDLKKDKEFKAPIDENALSKHFDDFNGDFDTPEEFIRACLRNDPRALGLLKQKPLDSLKDMLEPMSPEIRQSMERLWGTQAAPHPEKKEPAQESDLETPEPE